MAVTENEIHLKNINLSYPVTSGLKGIFTRELVGAMVGGIVEIDQRKQKVQIRALTDINLHIKPGTRTALIGNNGAGKTTLLRIMAGILHSDTGVRIASGKIIPLMEANVGLDDESTAYENIMLRGMLLGASGSELENIIDDILQLADLGEFIHLPLRTFSAGMRNRLAFAICTSVKPDILVVDEGFGAGDWHFMQTASQRFNQLLHGTESLVLATHSEDLMRQFCNQGVVMRKGAIMFTAPIDEAIQFYKEGNI